MKASPLLPDRNIYTKSPQINPHNPEHSELKAESRSNKAQKTTILQRKVPVTPASEFRAAGTLS